MEVSAQSLKGIFTALATPFTEEGKDLDFDSLGKLIEFQISSGVQGVVVCGSTGEAATLSDDEYRKVVLFTRDAMKGKGICIAGIGSSDTRRCIEIGRFLSEAKLDGILAVTPPYNKAPQRGLVQHFRALKEATTIPIVGYNVPGRTGVNLLPSTVGELVSSGLIVGLKESTGSVDQFLDTIAITGNRISLLAGECSLILSTIVVGGSGAISATANLIPGTLAKLAESALNERIEEARSYQLEALPVIRMSFAETNPIPIKAALKHLKIFKSASVRLPLVEASKETWALVEKVLPR